MIFDLPFNFWGNSVKVSFEKKKKFVNIPIALNTGNS